MATHSRAGEFCKVGENLYRYSSNGIYYGVFRDKGKLKWKSLKTTDKALAKRRLPTEINGARQIDPKSAKLTLGRLLEVHESNLTTLDTKTIKTRQCPRLDTEQGAATSATERQACFEESRYSPSQRRDNRENRRGHQGSPESPRSETPAPKDCLILPHSYAQVQQPSSKGQPDKHRSLMQNFDEDRVQHCRGNNSSDFPHAPASIHVLPRIVVFTAYRRASASVRPTENATPSRARPCSITDVRFSCGVPQRSPRNQPKPQQHRPVPG